MGPMSLISPAAACAAPAGARSFAEWAVPPPLGFRQSLGPGPGAQPRSPRTVECSGLSTPTSWTRGRGGASRTADRPPQHGPWVIAVDGKTARKVAGGAEARASKVVTVFAGRLPERRIDHVGELPPPVRNGGSTVKKIYVITDLS